MKKRLVFRPWAEKVLTCVFFTSFILMISTNDFGNLEGLFLFMLIICCTVVSGVLLSKYGKTFRKF